MRVLRAILLLLALLVVGTGCASTSGGGESPGYYGRGGSIHADSFPPDYSPGRVSGWGSYRRF